MSDKFQDIYRIPSARAEWWDYRNDAAYFVTICTAGREHYFGEIAEKATIVETLPGALETLSDSVETLHATPLRKNAPKQEMQLSEMGQVARQNWIEIPQHFPFIRLGEFVVMPNHVHGILVINHSVESPPVETLPGNAETLRISVETLHATSLLSTDQPRIKNEEMATISPKRGSLSSVMRSYKSSVSKQVREIHAEFAWQTRFYDHIIRDDQEFWKIREYIRNNPIRWKDDKYNQPDLS